MFPRSPSACLSAVVVATKIAVATAQGFRSFNLSYSIQLAPSIFIFLCLVMPSNFLPSLLGIFFALILGGTLRYLLVHASEVGRADQGSHDAVSIARVLKFWLAQIGLLGLFGLNEFWLVFNGLSPQAFSYELRYYLPVIALGPIISNFLWAELVQSDEKKGLSYILLIVLLALGLLVVRGHRF